MGKHIIAVIGCGTIANNAHIPAYMKNPKAEIKYFCDIIPERADNAVKKYGCGKAVYDYREILNDSELEAVSVCTPNYVHAPITIDFLNAGKHVLCEKPAARTYDEALAMLEAQRKTGKILNIGVVNRFNDGVNHIKHLIDAGELGDVYNVYASFRSQRSIPGLGGPFTTKAMSGGGVLIDWGVHFIDLILYCCGEPKPVTASAETFSVLGKNISEYVYERMWSRNPQLDGTYDVEEGITGIIRTTGPVITLNGAWAQNIGANEMYIDFIGSKAGIRLNYGSDFMLYSTKDDMLTSTSVKYRSSNQYDTEINAFVDNLENGERLPAHIESNIVTSQIMQALYDSAEQHCEITF